MSARRTFADIVCLNEFILEGAISMLSLLAQTQQGPQNTLENLFETVTSVFSSDGDGVGFCQEFRFNSGGT